MVEYPLKQIMLRNFVVSFDTLIRRTRELSNIEEYVLLVYSVTTPIFFHSTTPSLTTTNWFDSKWKFDGEQQWDYKRFYTKKYKKNLSLHSKYILTIPTSQIYVINKHENLFPQPWKMKGDRAQ